jgi:hypothetical protein
MYFKPWFYQYHSIFGVKKTLVRTEVFGLHASAVFSSTLQLKYFVFKHVLDWTDVKYIIVVL